LTRTPHKRDPIHPRCQFWSNLHRQSARTESDREGERVCVRVDSPKKDCQLRQFSNHRCLPFALSMMINDPSIDVFVHSFFLVPV
jgi:hypothetical protein